MKMLTTGGAVVELGVYSISLLALTVGGRVQSWAYSESEELSQPLHVDLDYLVETALRC